jgi:ribosomal protein L3 glutamine methyltransferase
VFGTPNTLGKLIKQGEKRFRRAGLVFGHGTDNAFDEACFLALEALALQAEQLPTYWNIRLTPNQITKITALYDARIKTRKPASYLVNKAYIQGYPFYVDERVIVPRSHIAEILCGDFTPVTKPPARVLDLCTGSGCLAILAAQLFPDAIVDAVELDGDALVVATRNVADYKLQKRMTLYQGDLYNPLPAMKYDLIITNPPYVDQEGMDGLPPEYLAEPALALAGGEDGMDLVHTILKRAPEFLTENGMLICELGRCGPALYQAYPNLPFSWLETENANDSVFYITRPDLPA